MAKSQKIRIRLKAFDHEILDLSVRKEIVTILRSPFKHKDSREQFESRTHKRLIDIFAPNQKTVEALMSLDMPAGVNIEIKL